MVKYIAFDFDGTLVDSKEVFLSAYNELARRHRFVPIDSSNLEALRRLPMVRRFKELGVPLYKVPFLTRAFLSLYREQLLTIPFVTGMETVLEQLQKKGVSLAIISSNSAATISCFLQHKGVEGLSDVYCSSKLFSKEDVSRSFMKKRNLKNSEMLYVCDELRDVTACRKLKVEPVWVGWGFEAKEALHHERIKYIAHTPEELLQTLQEAMLSAHQTIS